VPPPWRPEPSFAGEPAETQPIDRPTTSARPDGAWPEICDQFGAHLLVLAEQLRSSLNALEADEDDPDRLRRLYQVDHAVTRMRMASRQLRTLAGRDEERRAGFTTSLVDVIRMASAAIEWYPQVTIGPVPELAVLGYAADDVATLMSALLDNATRYSPGMVTVSCHLLEEGGVMFRIEDTGLGIAREKIPRRTAAFAGPVPEVNESTARHTGFPVVHRIARKHAIGVRFAARRRPGTGTLAMVILPPQLLCAIAAEDAPHRTAAAEPPATMVLDLPRRDLADLIETTSGQAESGPMPSPDADSEQAPPVEAAPLAVALPEAPPPNVVPAQALSVETTHDQDARRNELPRRERPTARGDEPGPAEAVTPPQPQTQSGAARRAFVDDLSAFSQGIQDALAARGITGSLVSAMFNGATIEEGAQS